MKNIMSKTECQAKNTEKNVVVNVNSHTINMSRWLLSYILMSYYFTCIYF